LTRTSSLRKVAADDVDAGDSRAGGGDGGSAVATAAASADTLAAGAVAAADVFQAEVAAAVNTLSEYIKSVGGVLNGKKGSKSYCRMHPEHVKTMSRTLSHTQLPPPSQLRSISLVLVSTCANFVGVCTVRRLRMYRQTCAHVCANAKFHLLYDWSVPLHVSTRLHAVHSCLATRSAQVRAVIRASTNFPNSSKSSP
jgi:hypothetical protein